MGGAGNIEISATYFVVEPSNVDGNRLVLTGEEARHLHQVLRANVGDVFYSIDGAGMKYRAVIDSISQSTVSGSILAATRLDNEPFCQVTLAQGVCRPNKMDEIVEKGTEIGVSGFIFYYSEKGYSKPRDESSSAKRIQRLRRIAKAAAKQCKRSVIPEIASPATFNDVLKLKNNYDLSLAAMIRSNSRPIESCIADSKSVKRILLLVGPESGLSDDEATACLNAGFLPVGLGPRRLRAETAGIIFPALVMSHLGET